VLLSVASEAPRGLLEGLVRHGAEPVVVRDVDSVMLHLAGGSCAVVLDEEAAGADRGAASVSQLLSAMHAYYPQAPVWRFTRQPLRLEPMPQRQGRGRRVDAAPDDDGRSEPQRADPPRVEALGPTPVSPGVTQFSPGATQFDGLSERDERTPGRSAMAWRSPGGDARSGAAGEGSPLLSEEELDMLLRPDASAEREG